MIRPPFIWINVVAGAPGLFTITPHGPAAPDKFHVGTVTTPPFSVGRPVYVFAPARVALPLLMVSVAPPQAMIPVDDSVKLAIAPSTVILLPVSEPVRFSVPFVTTVAPV